MAMNNGASFLSVVSTYAGYCQICQEPQMVGRIAVAGWPYHGAVCGRCLGQMADEVQRRAKALPSDEASSSHILTTGVAGNGSGLAATARGNGHIR